LGLGAKKQGQGGHRACFYEGKGKTKEEEPRFLQPVARTAVSSAFKLLVPSFFLRRRTAGLSFPIIINYNLISYS
ncbi:MAG: hypothetical protein ACT6RN_27705, partial [Agrobacterium sp.]|uniref:hypothetical protein n=1 Tax=Agrobacterium sp. TaxID=361 RepID=UPI0040379B09